MRRPSGKRFGSGLRGQLERLEPRELLAASLGLGAGLNVVRVVPPVDLAVAKTVSEARPDVGGMITFSVTVTNPSDFDVPDVLVNDVIPLGFGLEQVMTSQGSYSPTAGVWNVGTVVAGQTASLTLLGRVTGCEPFTNVAVIAGAGLNDPNLENNEARVTVTPVHADLALAKTVSPAELNVLENATFTLTLTNLGPDAGRMIVVQDAIPAGLGLVTATPSAGVYHPTTGLWSIDTLAAGSSATLTLVVTSDTPGSYVNQAFIAGSETADCTTDDNAARATVLFGEAPPPPQADVRIVKTVSEPRPDAGQTITFLVTVQNLSEERGVSGVIVRDVPPPNVVVTNVVVSQGALDESGWIWAVGALGPGGMATLTATARVVSCDPFENTAEILQSTPIDPNPENNSSTVEVTPRSADLVLEKTVDNTAPVAGQAITFTVTLSNLGPDSSRNIVVNDALPGAFQFISATASIGTYDAMTGNWSIAELLTTGVATLLITALPVTPGPAENVAFVAHTDTCDPNPGDSSSRLEIGIVDPELVSPCVTDFARYGYHHQRTELVLYFNRPLDPERAEDVRNYQLVRLRSNGREEPIRIATADYNPSAGTVRLQPIYRGKPRLPLHARYRITVIGEPPDGLTSPQGVPLDGACDGTIGSNYVHTFGAKALAGRVTDAPQRPDLMPWVLADPAPGMPFAAPGSGLRARRQVVRLVVR